MLKSRQKKQLATENQALRDYCDQVTEDLSFLAASPQMVRIRQQILQIAPVDVPVFICGESGVGKEVVARMIHLRSRRRNQPFVKVNCAALPGELLESELFGFEQGAFTGAVRSKPGKVELANKGTIFLDEIAEMSRHLEQCVTCQQRIALYKQGHSFLVSRLYRRQCPDGTTLSLYCAGLLPEDQRTGIKNHILDCPLCAAEAEDSRQFLAETDFLGSYP